MKTIYIAGIGMNAKTANPEAVSAISSADALIGASRMINAFSHLGKPSFAAYGPNEVYDVISKSDYAVFAVIVSGDVGFFSGAARLTKALAEFDVRLIAGVPSVCGFCARLKIPWQDARLISAHGSDADIVSEVRRNRLVFCLTGGNTQKLGKKLCESGFGELTVHTGENLGYENEKISAMTALKLAEAELSPLSVILVENPDFDDSAPFGLPDESFERLSGIPMTKSAVRAVCISRLRLSPGDICYDVGAGTGSVTAEMALQAYKGHVYAIERSDAAIPLINQNLKNFRVGNVSIIKGTAPDAFNGLPAPHAAFIGGSGGALKEITGALLAQNPQVRIVITAIALETALNAVKTLEESKMKNIEVTQISASNAKNINGLHLMTAQNPVTIISGTGA